MKINNDGMDERQRATRNKIGYQSFMMIAYLLFLDIFLSGIGFKWVAYPTNIMIIITVCLIIHLVRLIKNDSYVTKGVQARKPNVTTIAAVILTAVLAALLAFSLVTTGVEDVNAAEDYSAYILVTVSVIGLIIVGITSYIKKRNDKDE